MQPSNRRNKYDHKDSLEIGDNAQLLFLEIAGKKRLVIAPATKEQDIHEHWDFKIVQNGIPYKVDVKARKRVGRGDSNFQDRYVWIELHSVRPYDQGWLYGGKADLIAFEREYDFVIVWRKDLIHLVEKLVDFKTKVSSAKEAVYKVYQRIGRPDEITLIDTEKLFDIKYSIWGKNIEEVTDVQQT